MMHGKREGLGARAGGTSATLHARARCIFANRAKRVCMPAGPRAALCVCGPSSGGERTAHAREAAGPAREAHAADGERAGIPTTSALPLSRARRPTQRPPAFDARAQRTTTRPHNSGDVPIPPGVFGPARLLDAVARDPVRQSPKGASARGQARERRRGQVEHDPLERLRGDAQQQAPLLRVRRGHGCCCRGRWVGAKHTRARRLQAK